MSPQASFISDLTSWLFEPPDNLPLIKRLMGLAVLPVLLLIWVWSHGGPGPYTVAPWRWGADLLAPPVPPETLTIAAFVAAVLSCIMLISGSRQKWPVFIIVAVISYYGFSDLLACHCSFVILSLWFMIALLFDNHGRPSCCRRLIQLAVFCCYFFSVLQKCFFPDFVAGFSFQALFADGWPLRSFLQPVIVAHALPLEFYRLMSGMTIVLETYLAFALFFARTRKSALIIGFIFHLTILICLDDSNLIALYSVFMFIAYLAFMAPLPDFPGSSRIRAGMSHLTGSLRKFFKIPVQAQELSSVETKVARNAEIVLALLFMLVMLVVPLRIYFWPGRSCATLSFFDRSPASFAMFLMRQQPKSLSVRYESKDGIWHDFPIKGRMVDASSDNEIFALSNYVFNSREDVEQVKIDVTVTINKRWLQTKSFQASRSNSSLIVSNAKLEPSNTKLETKIDRPGG